MRFRKELFASAIFFLGVAAGGLAGFAADEPPAGQPPAAPPANYSSDRIEQLVAPIALYPDALLAQVLMAATYPAEIAKAAYWLQGNPNLGPEDMNFEMQGKPWDPSVKALVAYAEVLYKLNANLDWTRDLGNAVLGQQPAVLDAIQKLRAQAKAAGNLASDKQQAVTAEPDNIQIQPADPQQVYVPAYDPVTVYGSGWGYPTWYYPGVYNNYGRPGNYRDYGLYGNCDWRKHNLYVDRQRFINLYHTDPNFRQEVNDIKQRVWQHDPDHRHGVPYHNAEIQSRYAAQLAAEHSRLNQYKGYHQTGASMPRAQNTAPALQGPPQHSSAAVQHLEHQLRDSGPAVQPGAAAGATHPLYSSPAVQHLENQVATCHQGQGRMNAFSGAANPAADYAAWNRGAGSRTHGSVHYNGGGRVYDNGGAIHYNGGGRIHDNGGGRVINNGGGVGHPGAPRR